MKVIFGLGNPGSEYAGTRHNIGFEVLDALALALRVSFVPGSGEYEIATSRTGSGILLVKPLTFMNNSGFAVRDVLSEFAVAPEDTLTIIDDFDLPLGTLRLRKQGSAGTHNGLASIIWSLGSGNFPRLRCGIGSDLKPPDKRLTAEFVLSPFAREERKIVEEMIVRACLAARVFGEQSLQQTFEVLAPGK